MDTCQNKQKDAASTSTSNTTLITTPLLQHRLSLGLGIAGGARGSLNRCAVQLAATAHAATAANADTDTIPDTSEATIKQRGLLLTDLSLQQLEMTKLLLQVQRNEQELQRYSAEEEEESSLVVDKDAMDTSISDTTTTKNSITNVQLRQQVQRSQQVQLCLQEYEALAALTVAQHVVSEHALSQQMHELEQQHDMALRDLDSAATACRIRASQFHLLQQCIQDMKQSVVVETTAAAAAAAPTAIVVPHSKQTTEATMMDINNDEPNTITTKDGQEEEGELYGDL